MSEKKLSVREALEKIYPFLFGEFERLISQNEDWLVVLNKPLDSSIDSLELEELLSQWGDSFVQEGRDELVQLLNPINKYKRNFVLRSNNYFPVQLMPYI